MVEDIFWLPTLGSSAHHLIPVDIILIWEKRKYIWLEGMLDLFKRFAAQSYLLSFMACSKLPPFFIFYEKYWMSSCLTCWIRNSDTLMSLAMDLIEMLGSLSIKVWISATNSRVIFLSERSERGFWAVVSSESPFDSSNSFHCLQISTLWNIRIGDSVWMPSSTVCRFQISVGVNFFMVLLST